MKSLSVTIEMKAIKQYFPVVLTIQSVDDILFQSVTIQLPYFLD